MKKIFNILITRWRAKMPIFFKWIMGIGTAIITISMGIETAMESSGCSIPEWWTSAYPYLIGISAGMITSAKFTQKQ